MSRQQLLIAFAAIAILGSLVTAPVSGAAARAASVKACYKKKSGAVRIATGRKACRRGERRIMLNRLGPRGKRGARGPAGPTGPVGPSGSASNQGTGPQGVAGPIGAAGPTGSSGPTGPTGPTGPSSSAEALNAGPVSITGTDTGSANSLATQSGVAPGSYQLTARVQLNSLSTTASEIACVATLGGKSSQGIANIGTNAGNTAHAVVTMTFNVTLAATGTANLSCFRESLTGTAPTASDAYVELLQVGSATSQTVSG